MTEKIIKSDSRVKSHGEVFTPKKIVRLILDQPGIMENVNSLSSTFLEPSAGEGAFLTEVLKRKMSVATHSTSFERFNNNSLVCLSSLYGIELLEDNVEMLVMNMFSEFYRDYLNGCTLFKSKPRSNVLKSAKVIIQANMVQGDALKRTTMNGDPIVLSEWKLLPIKRGVRKVQRNISTFDSIIGQSDLMAGSARKAPEQMELFEDSREPNQNPDHLQNFERYTPVKFEDVYKRQTITLNNG
ncbi:hypothetical protein LASUN_01190 [Lentilactobacillus sunkii]|uniref:DNA methylase adenine-specific domain-containing protein n=1 Tax=Lentilactobacillus sunkii TaxID=481719 RepID=A0A1E7XJ37_9LACO|nr:N-6 DNA methylase [Lentilactobacillus sunkii]OFA13120.1 hypothetical protein LASUN_01190 [Lentilactobacillus sunkii]